MCCVYSGQTRVNQGDGLGLNHVGFLKALMILGVWDSLGTDPSVLGVHPLWVTNPRII